MSLAILVFGPMMAALVSYLIGRKNKPVRDLFVIGTCAAVLALVLVLLVSTINGAAISLTIGGFCGFGLNFVLDGFRAVYTTVAGVMWLGTAMLSKQYFAHHYHNRNRYYFFYLMTLGATLGVFLSADLYTTFIFFEIMSFTSYTWVAHDENAGAMRAAETYLAVAVIGGMVMLVGLMILKFTLGTLVIAELYEAAEECADKGTIFAACICILLGFGAKAGMFPLHIWLPKAHPVAPAPASALLSGILTKTGVFGVIAVSANIFRESADWGNLLLMLAMVTMLSGAVLAVFSVNLKRTLACSSMSQIGFILTGIAMSCLLGEENALAARGALLYMINHSLFKLILFMAAGVVYLHLHKLDLNDVRGFGRGKIVLQLAFICGAVGLMGVPLFSGYVSKTLIHEGIVEYVELLHEEHMANAWIYSVCEWVYLFSGGLTGAYMIKLYICLFHEKNADAEVQKRYDALNRRYMTLPSLLALAGAAVLVPLLGVAPNLTMDAIADFGGGFLHAEHPAHAVAYFSLTNLKGAGISLTIGALVYLLFIRKVLIKNGRYLNLWPAKVDIEDRVYRPAIDLILKGGGMLAQVGNEQKLEKVFYKPLIGLVTAVGAFFAKLGSESVLEDLIYKPLLRCLSLTGGVIAAAIGSVTDLLADWTSRRVLSEHHRRRMGLATVGNPLTRGLDLLLDKAQRHPGNHHVAADVEAIHHGIEDGMARVSHTLSYTLLMFCVGILAAVLYLLLA